MKDKGIILKMVKIAVVAAIYVALTIGFAPISYGAIQFRISELLLIFIFFDKKYGIGLILGTAIANIFSAELGLPDVIFGTLATIIALLIMYFMGKSKKLIYLTPLVPALVNGLIVGLELHIILELPFWLSALEVFLGELAVCVVGLIIYLIIRRNKTLVNLLAI